MKSTKYDGCSRRSFLKASIVGITGVATIPMIVSCSVLRKDAPSKKINILQIGCGRIGRSMDMPGILKQDDARMVAVCDFDSIRVADAKKYVEDYYSRKNISIDVTAYGDYREALQRSDIDAVAVSTPDHWHAQPVIEAALAGKDIYVQKPLTMTVVEGRAVSNIIRKKKRAFQIGSQQRSEAQFRMACELVRSGRIGKLHTVKVGLPTDPSGGRTTEMPVPANLNYDAWLGCTQLAPYNEDRVHSQNTDPKKRYGDRPGWLRIDTYCLGMITGWGAHHVDIGHWGMDTELTGPISVEGKAEFPTSGLWNVHGPYHIESKYANGVTMIIDNTFTTGVRFEGTDGWIFVSRGSGKVTASDPASGKKIPLDASNPDIIKTPLGEKDVKLHVSEKGDHHLDWITSIKTRKPAATSPEQAHRSCTACNVAWISMKLGRKLTWDPAKERFVNDDQANAMLSRPQRAPYGIDRILKKT
ncbi:MAG: Gfo/Idh/MocA family oxidoreductase [Kiritimatiellae bacterium]|nr:Gfo/Idh/MocA family oxidoreductase [Kiritimatiellia bacterium]MDD5522891.1 Gfo/Idh/MocA family oxidoreductase [Kiritimatiellia bacterium]